MAKIPICLYALQQSIYLNDLIKLKKEDIVSGTGWLQYAPIGLELRVKDILYLILAESDNTATRCLVRHLGGAELINKWLAKKSKVTRLEIDKRSPGQFTYGETSPLEIAELLEELLKYPVAEDFLKGNRFDWGLRRKIDPAKRKSITKIKDWAFIRHSKLLTDNISRYLLTNKRPKAKYPNKDGSYHGYRHEVARINGYTVAILTSGFDPVLPYDKNHPAFNVFRQLGEIIVTRK